MITAFCLQTSALKSDLHEIKGKIVIGSATEIENCQCTCKAGDSGCCKHISGTLLYISRLCHVLYKKKWPICLLLLFIIVHYPCMFSCFDLCVFSFFRKPIEELKLFSCTEGTCKRKSKLGTLNNYEPQPVANSKCFKTLKKKTANINVEFVHNVAKEMLPRSSWNLHR
jgi:hypothetical protein